MLDYREMECTGHSNAQVSWDARSQGDTKVDTDLSSRAEVSSPQRAHVSATQRSTFNNAVPAGIDQLYVYFMFLVYGGIFCLHIAHILNKI